MKSSIRFALTAAALVSLADPVTAMARPAIMTDLVTGYSAAQDYVDTLSGKVFTAAKRASDIAASDEAAQSYIEGFGRQARHIETSSKDAARTGDGLTQPYTLIR